MLEQQVILPYLILLAYFKTLLSAKKISKISLDRDNTKYFTLWYDKSYLSTCTKYTPILRNYMICYMLNIINNNVHAQFLIYRLKCRDSCIIYTCAVRRPNKYTNAENWLYTNTILCYSSWTNKWQNSTQKFSGHV